MVPLLVAVLLFMCGSAFGQTTTVTTDDAFTSWLGGLRDGGYAEKEQIVEQMTAGVHASTRQYRSVM